MTTRPAPHHYITVLDYATAVDRVPNRLQRLVWAVRCWWGRVRQIVGG